MVTKRVPGTEEDWELASGFASDFDGWVRGARFGAPREEYVQKVGQPTVSLNLPLYNAEGELLATQSYSLGSGWIVTEDGQGITHPVRSNIVKTSLYGKLIARVTTELGVDMRKYGTPLRASTWDGLGFHWILQPHPIVAGGEREGLMPSEFLGDQMPEGAVSKPEGLGVSPELEKQLARMAKTMNPTEFKKAAIRIETVVDNDPLMAHVMDTGPEGFWATHQE